jgi:5-methylcytosine-specific restriction protein A
MPNASKRPCAIRSCPKLTDKRFCEDHEREHWQGVNRNDGRPSAAVRGYDRRWNKLAKMYLRAPPLCEVCESKGLTTPARLVHHKVEVDVRPDLRLAWDNLQSVCKRCHEAHHGWDR